MTPMSDTGRPRSRRCYVHIGLQKTGTSYLQSIFWQSGDALRAQDLVMVPASKRETFMLMLAIRDRLRAGVDPAWAFEAPDRLQQRVRTVDAARTLLTEESLSGADDEQAKRLVDHLDGVEVHVVVTVRDIARQVPSVWQQRLTAGGTDPFDTFVSRVVERHPKGRSFWRGQDLVEILDRWSALVPPDRIHVVTVPPAGAAPEVLLDRFCSVVGVDPGSLDTRAAHGNVSLGRVQAELLRRVNLALGDRLVDREAYRETGKMYLAKRVLSAQGGDRARVPAELEDWCREVTAVHVATVRDGGFHVVGDLADLEPDAGSFVTTPDAVSDAELVDVAAETLATVLVDRHEALARRRGARTRRPTGPVALGARLRRRVGRVGHDLRSSLSHIAASRTSPR